MIADREPNGAGVIRDQCQDCDRGLVAIFNNDRTRCKCHGYVIEARTITLSYACSRERDRDRERKREREKCVSSLESFGRVHSDHEDLHICSRSPLSDLIARTPRTDERKRHEVVVARVHGRFDREQINPFSGGKGRSRILPMQTRCAARMLEICMVSISRSRNNLTRA